MTVLLASSSLAGAVVTMFTLTEPSDDTSSNEAPSSTSSGWNVASIGASPIVVKTWTVGYPAILGMYSPMYIPGLFGSSVVVRVVFLSSSVIVTFNVDS